MKEHTAAEAELEYATISSVARELGVSLRTIRFYEDKKLIRVVRRGLVRLYDKTAVDRLKTILELKGFEFSLAEIADLIGPMNRQISGQISHDAVDSQIDYLLKRIQEMSHAVSRLQTIRRRK